MKNTGDREIGGAFRNPSARPSIHSHPFCPFALGETMGRYGLERKQQDRRALTQQINQSNDQDTDEVDNAFSKPMYSNNLTFANRGMNRRRSLDENEQPEQKDISKLSKSLPETIPLHSYCSDDDDGDEVQTPVRQEHQHSDISHSSSLDSPTNRGTVYRTPVNRSPFNQNMHSTPSSRNTPKQKDDKDVSSKLLPLLLLVGVAVTIASMFNANTPIKAIYDESRFYNDIDQLGNKYRIDDNAVLQVQTGIATIFKRQDTGSFIFVYNSDEDKFDSREFNRFINDVSNTASKYLRNDSTPVHYTLVEATSLDMFGHSELISTFRDDLDRTGVMLVKHVEAIPSTLAMAFHYYCDEYNPLVKKSAIFFTLNLAMCPQDRKSTHAVIEKCLTQKWASVPADSIGPLLARVVSVVIDLTKAF